MKSELKWVMSAILSDAYKEHLEACIIISRVYINVTQWKDWSFKLLLRINKSLLFNSPESTMYRLF